jgi:hypothetical protein
MCIYIVHCMSMSMSCPVITYRNPQRYARHVRTIINLSVNWVLDMDERTGCPSPRSYFQK